MNQKGLLTYAFSSDGNFVHIDTVVNGLACDCFCPSCKERLVAKNGGTKRIHHFAHASGIDCEKAYETMLHLLAKIRVQEAFITKEVFNLQFEYRSHCPHIKICFHTPVAFGIYEMAKYQGYKRFGIKNCLYCKNYVDSYDGMGKLCRLYKHLGINRFDQHDTARAKDCSRFLLNQEEMDEELKRFESLNKNEYTELE